MCGTGVISRINTISSPAACIARMAVSRPAPGPLTMTSAFFIPCPTASLLAFSAAICAAKGVPFFAPLKPIAPLDAQETVSPVAVLMVTIVLLNVDCMCATPFEAVFFAFLPVFLFICLAFLF